MLMLDNSGMVWRWAVSDGPLLLPVPDGSTEASASCGDVVVEAAVDGSSATVADPSALMPEVGIYGIEWTADGSLVGAATVERVGNRYCTEADVMAYGERNGDEFERVPDYQRAAAIQTAEEAIEDACSRSFCERAKDVRLVGDGRLEELPMVDARAIEDAVLVGDRQCTASEPGLHRVVYGSATDSRVRSACTQLAAYLMRSRVTPENARGTSQDGVYISYTLATGEDGSWTGLPYVDSVIEEKRSRRVMVR